MNKIKVLSEQDISKIAAGEVVERPSAIVKELFENSVDAGSTEIIVEIEGGGKDLVKVTDNGTGIPKDEAVLAFERHATSKISGIGDLYTLETMGFRGEALHSMATVARVVLTTRTAVDDAGCRIEMMGGVLRSSGEVAALKGTCVEVTDLFYNTPVRWKFMKTTLQETRSCIEIVSRLAVSNPNISVVFKSDGELVFRTDGKGDKMSAVFQVFGSQIAGELMKLELNTADIAVSGLSSRLSLRKRNRNYIMTFVNGRYVKSVELQRTIEGCYRQHLMGGEFPVSFVFVDVDPSEIDVNVHPAKTEIKFADYQRVERAVASAIKMALSMHTHVPSIGGGKFGAVSNYDEEKAAMAHYGGRLGGFAVARDSGVEVEAAMYGAVRTDASAVLADRARGAAARDGVEQECVERCGAASERLDRGGAEQDCLVRDGAEQECLTQERLAQECVKQSAGYEQQSLWSGDCARGGEDAVRSIAPVRVIGIYDSTFIIAESGGELYFIDQHAAHEKILYEEYVASVLKDSVPVQQLALPFEMGVDRGYVLPPELDKLGFEAEIFGEDSVVVRGIPSSMNESYARNILRAVFDDSWDGATPYDIATKSCKAAIKGGDFLSDMEAENLIGRLFKLENPYNCPHGRPIIIKMTRREIDKLFRRIV